MKKYFSKNLRVEACRIKTIFVIYSLTYVTRGIIYVLHKRVYDQLWRIMTLTYFVMFNIWDVLPLSLIMAFHYTCFEEKKRPLPSARSPQQSPGQDRQSFESYGLTESSNRSTTFIINEDKES